MDNMDIIEVSQEAINNAKFLGRGIINFTHVADLWELRDGPIVELYPGTRKLRRIPALETHTQWQREGDHWVPNINANEQDSNHPETPAKHD